MDAEALVGEVFAGRTIVRLLGRGGMGAVYLAQASDGAPAVLKFLAAEVAREPALRARFLREGAALQRLPTSPHVVRFEGVHEAGERLFLVMEYVAGLSMLGAIQRRGRLPAVEAARLAIDVARGLEVVHAQGIVHRDVKPANVVLTEDGRAKLVDFGLAKDLFRTALTVPGQLLGTAAYMAPEQWSGAPADARADVFSLGATLYHALVGAPPFDGADLGQIADQAENGDFPLPRDAYPEVPEELERVVLRMLMPEPRYRHATAFEVARDLEGVLAGHPARTPCLVAADGRRHLLLPEVRYTLGRDAGCDLTLEDESVSRRHAQVSREPEGFLLCDLRSTLGTFVEETRLATPRLLKHGDSVRLGRLVLTFDDGSAAPARG